MAHTLEDRRHYALPLDDANFELIRTHCIHVGHEVVADYRHSQDGLLIQVKCYHGSELPEMEGLALVDNEDANWIAPIEDFLSE